MADKATDFVIWKSVFYASLEGTAACEESAALIVVKATDIADAAVKEIERRSAESLKGDGE